MNDETRSFSCAPRRIDTATRHEVVTHTPSHFLQASLDFQSRDRPPIPYPNNEPNGDNPPSLTLSAWGFASLRLHPLSLAVVGGGRLRGSCISHSSLEGSGPCGNDSAPRPTISQPTTIVHWTSQHCRSCARSPDFTHSASEADTLDIQPEVRDLAKRASRYSFDLGDTVHRDIENYVTGGSTFVYRGTLEPAGTAIAVKTFRFGHKSDPSVMKSICREVHIWSKLHHDNILPVLGFTTKFDHTISIVSPWMERGNAHAYVQNVDVDPRPLLVGIATGLQYLHSYEPHPIYHGDLKGFNVLISDHGCPLLADFGFAFIVNSSFSMDVEGSRGGTLHWMGPEYFGVWEDSTAAEGDACVATAEKDIWAFGMTVLELFTRERPFPEVNTVPQLILRMRSGHPRPTDEATYFRLTDEWWNICLLCWHLDPSTRPRMSDILAKISMGPSR
ncbi:hypothetical protein SCLCIDRAFT_1216606 [Scleroderma citrinum Foug A]|uniref:Protein kinase domain-containing protein n=1 Tax=Scleroderma citrinum Foug A TaxID=1036808 RepID=A0A0C3DXV0_9AGAM|nr:hypothetical protein SCLCIDRAFT_1216606 [Scleroderma citrinum Foug A]